MKSFLLTLIICLSIFNFAAAENILRVGYVPETGFLEEDRQGHIRGYGFEYMEFLSRYTHRKFEYIPCTSWRDAGEKLQNGTIDLLPAMPGDYRSLQNVTRTDHVIGRYAMELVTKDGKTKPHMKIANSVANPPIPGFPKMAVAEGFTYELINYNSFYEQEEALNRGDVDGYIAPMLQPAKEKNVAAVFDRQSYRLLVKSDNKDLLAEMNNAMDEMLMDQPNIRNRLNDKYLRPGGSPLILNKFEKDYLTEKGKLRTVIFLQIKPYAYYEDGELRGVIPNLIKQMSQDLGVAIEIVPTEKSSEAVALIRRGAVDFVADCICDFSWAATFNMAPTQSYLQLDYVAVTRQGEEVSANARVACVPDLLYTQNFIYPRYPEEQRVICNNLAECFEAVSDGRADILYAPRNEVNFILEETSTYNLAVESESVFADEVSLGVYTDTDQRLWRILNKEVNHLDLAKIRGSVNEGMNTDAVHLSLQWQIYHHPLRVMGFMVILAGIVGSIAYYRMILRRKHLNQVQQMAFTDSRYQMPNLSWLETELPKNFTQDDDAEENFYIAAFQVENLNSRIFQNKNLMTEQVKAVAAELNKAEEVILTSTGEDLNSLICAFKCKDLSSVTRVAREVIRKRGFLKTGNAKIFANIRVGIAEVDKKHLHRSIKNAQDACLHSAKDIKIFDATLQDEIVFENQIESLMQNALDNGEFQAWYQTEYEIATHKPVAEEAFVRWQSAELGFLQPSKFMKIFERTGFITAVDYFMVEEACKLQRVRLDEGKELLPISINQSGLHLSEEDYVDKMRKLLQKYKLPKGCLKLEFSEKVFINLPKNDQEKRLTNIIRSLQKLGFKIATDDFGEGYSSYHILNYLSLDEMKIDGTILYAAVNSERTRDILENIIQLGKKLGMKVICEGVETKAQEKLLTKLGCQFAQGFINSALITEPNEN